MKRLTLALSGLLSISLSVGCCCSSGGGCGYGGCAPQGYSPYGAPAGAYIQSPGTQAAFGQPVAMPATAAVPGGAYYGPQPTATAILPMEALPTY